MSSKSRLLVSAALAVSAQLAVAQDAREKPDPIPMSMALKLGVENLTDNTGVSEVGQDRAAQIYAAARRVETEHALAEKDMKLVLALDEWREALAHCRGDFYSLAYIVNGGGTMYSHAQARDCSEVEDFLGDLAKRLPLEGKGKGDAKAVKQIDDTMAFLKSLKPYDPGDAKSLNEMKSELAAKIKESGEHLEIVKGMFSEIPAEDARKTAEFAVAPVSWLKEDGAN